ncbi:MAG: alpha/beta hydrolase [Bacteriovoracaceae bacterium]|nr:alpha/beta hydrolase [Bacteriovoracaceae bacterium]
MANHYHTLLRKCLRLPLGPLAFSHEEAEFAPGLKASIFRPRDEKIYPAVVLVHGGSWGGRSKEDMGGIAQYLASHGFVVLNTSYRFAPAHRYPAQIDDLTLAIDWFKNQNQKYLFDPSRLGGWGYSAGGHLITQWALLQGKEKQSMALKAVVAGGAPFDLSWYPYSPIITHLLDGFRDERPQEYFEASPVNHLGDWAPDMFLYHGIPDRLVEAVQSSHMQNLLRRFNKEARLHLVKKMGHINTFIWAGSAVSGGMNFLKEKLN